MTGGKREMSKSDRKDDVPHTNTGSLMLQNLDDSENSNKTTSTEEDAEVGELPLSDAEKKLMEQLSARKFDRPEGPKILAPPSADSESAEPFPDLPDNLRPQRADGSGALTQKDIKELKLSGVLPPLASDSLRRAESAIEHINDKMRAVTVDFSTGRINHAQFQAVYTRYLEQRTLIERVLSRDPNSSVWESIYSEGETTLLQQQYAPTALGCVLIENKTGEIIRVLGTLVLPDSILMPLVSSLRSTSKEDTVTGERTTQIDDGQWLSVTIGDLSTCVVLFSHEPAVSQRMMLTDLQRDFELANRRALARGKPEPERLVYPHRSLFEQE